MGCSYMGPLKDSLWWFGLCRDETAMASELARDSIRRSAQKIGGPSVAGSSFGPGHRMAKGLASATEGRGTCVKV